MQIKKDCQNDVLEFLKEYPKPSIRLATTLKHGAAVCIKPVPTICGPEIMCRPEDQNELRKLIDINQ